MSINNRWAEILFGILPIAGVLVILYSDVQSLKVAKADKQELMEFRIEYTRQMTRNTTAIENLNETLKRLRGDNEQERSNRG